MDRIWTIGYETAGLDAFIATLKLAGIATLVDVRDIANSRRAGFAKRALSEGLAAAGIGYVHVKALGTPKSGRDANKRGDMAAFRQIYCEALDQPEAQLALREAADLAGAGRVCLMCLEADWRRCHRAEIAARLAADFRIDATHLSVD